MKAEVIQGWVPLKGLEGEWNALLHRSRADSIFLTWEWMEAWQGAAGRSVEPFVIAVRDHDGALVGLAPFYFGRLRLLGLMSYRVLRMLGDYHSGAEYPDWILAPGCEEAAARAIVDALLTSTREWDCLWIARLAGWTGAHERIATTCSAAGLFCRQRPHVFSAAALPDDAASYVRSLSGNARSSLKRQSRHVFSSRLTTFDQCGSAADLPAYLDALVDLNHLRWRAAGQVGTFVRKPLEHRFYRLFAPRALERGWLRLFGIRTDGRLAAVQVGYAYNQTFLQLQEGFDPDGPPGLGNVLRSRVIEQCIREGIRHFDFLGGHTEHKGRWLAKPRTGHDLLICRRSFRNRLLISLPLWPTGRYLREAGLPTPMDERVGPPEGPRSKPFERGAPGAAEALSDPEPCEEQAGPGVLSTDPTGRERMARNVLASWTAHAVFVVGGFLLPRIIDRRLGQEVLGLWDFSWSLVSYFGLAEIGVGSSLARYAAKYRAAGDVAGLNRAASSVMLVQAAAATLCLAATAAVSLSLPYLFGTKIVAHLDVATPVVALLGTSLAIEIAFDTFHGVITGCHRWDLHNAINAGFYAVQTVAMISLLLAGGGLPGLALVYLLGVLAREITRRAAAYQVCPELAIAASKANWGQ